jgi:hypothetical protein
MRAMGVGTSIVAGSSARAPVAGSTNADRVPSWMVSLPTGSLWPAASW